MCKTLHNVSSPSCIDRYIPLFASYIECGFPSPADDYLEGAIDLNELLIKKPAATFIVRAKGDSMIEAGIFEGDLIIIDRSITPSNCNIILGALDGEFTLKRLLKYQNKVFLKSENPNYKTLEINKDRNFEVWGVATFNLHKLRL